MYPLRFTFCSLVWPLLVLATEIIAQDSSPNLQGTKNSAQSSLIALANLLAVTSPDSVSKNSMQVSKSSLASSTAWITGGTARPRSSNSLSASPRLSSDPSPGTQQAVLSPDPVVQVNSKGRYPVVPIMYVVNGITHTRSPQKSSDAVDLTSGNATAKLRSTLSSLSGHTYPQGSLGSLVAIDGTISSPISRASKPLPIPGSAAGALTPSLTATPSSAHSLDGVVFTGTVKSGFTVHNSVILSDSSPIKISSQPISLPTSDSGSTSFTEGTLSHPPSQISLNVPSQGFSQSSSLVSGLNASPGLNGIVGSIPLATTVPTSLRSDNPSPSITLSDGSGSYIITSTDTVEPSNASTEPTTNTAWTDNLWLTTQVNGHTTIVPVIVGCPGCGGRGGGIILWNFPAVPKVSFKFPGLPKLPSISFPCVPIPLIKKCSSHPKTENSNGGEGGNEGDPGKPHEPKNPEDPNENDPPDKKDDPSDYQSSEKQVSATSDKTSVSSSASSTTSPSSTSSSETSSSSSCVLSSYAFSLTPGTDSTTLDTESGTTTRSASATPSASSNGTITSESACPLTYYTFSLTSGKDSTTIDTGTGTSKSSISAAPSVSSNETLTTDSACQATPYEFALTPGTDSTTLNTDSETRANSAPSSASSIGTIGSSSSVIPSSETSNATCRSEEYSFSLTSGTDSTTLDTEPVTGSDSLTRSNVVLTTGISSTSKTSRSASASVGQGSFTATSASTTTRLPTCIADGAPWYSPTSWCDCGTSMNFPTLPFSSGATDSSANCQYTSLDPSKTITPLSVSAAPSNIPGENGLPGCALVLEGDGQGCPSVDYCNCGGTYVGFLTATFSGTASRNCDYTVQPTANDCPINTAAENSISSASAVSASAAATSYDPKKTTLSCGQKYSTDTGAVYTSVPRSDTPDILKNAEYFCTPSKNIDGTTLVLEKDHPISHNIEIDAPGVKLYQYYMTWDPRPECADDPAPVLKDSEPTGPDYWCNVYFDAITNTCDSGPGQDKNGGTLYSDCVIYAWEAFDACTGKEPHAKGCG